jgi:hypothetical protein
MRIWVAIAVLMAALSWVDACVHGAALEKLQARVSDLELLVQRLRQ